MELAPRAERDVRFARLQAALIDRLRATSSPLCRQRLFSALFAPPS